MEASAGRPRRLRPRQLGVGLGLLVAAVVAGIGVGPVSIPPSDVVGELLSRLPFATSDSGLDDRRVAVLWELRIPRVVLGAIVGGTLATAGVAYQGVFRNPLADPYLLGVAAGAGMGATLVIASGVTGSLLLPLAAFAGGMVSVVATYGLARIGGGGRQTSATLILAGIAVAAFFTAVQTLVQQLSTDTIREVFSWMLGRLSTVGWVEIGIVAPFVAVGVLFVMAHARHLDLLAVGEEEATSLGLPAARVRALVVVAATLATAAVVAVSGLIGFVGIVVPHAVRRVAGSSHRVLLPLAFLAGGAFLVLADVVARTLVAPAELPIGVVTAFVGAPFFALILRRTRGSLS